MIRCVVGRSAVPLDASNPRNPSGRSRGWFGCGVSTPMTGGGPAGVKPSLFIASGGRVRLKSPNGPLPRPAAKASLLALTTRRALPLVAELGSAPPRPLFGVPALSQLPVRIARRGVAGGALCPCCVIWPRKGASRWCIDVFAGLDVLCFWPLQWCPVEPSFLGRFWRNLAVALAAWSRVHLLSAGLISWRYGQSGTPVGGTRRFVGPPPWGMFLCPVQGIGQHLLWPGTSSVLSTCSGAT